MQTARQRFYGHSALSSFSLPDVLDGHVIRINPALIPLIDERVDTTPPATLQPSVQDQVMRLVSHKIHTFHVDVNYPDYKGYGRQPPAINTHVFTPTFLQDLNALVRSKGGFLNLHLLTNSPLKQLRRYDHIELGAVCFQLEVLRDAGQLAELIDHPIYGFFEKRDFTLPTGSKLAISGYFPAADGRFSRQMCALAAVLAVLCYKSGNP
jgi:hypothetical protein